MLSSEFARTLKKGQILLAEVEEVLSSTETICAFHGDLLRISNHSGMAFKKGQPIKLQVVSLNPLTFQVYSSKNFQRVV